MASSSLSRSTLRKDTAAGRAAAVRRRQRVSNTANADPVVPPSQRPDATQRYNGSLAAPPLASAPSAPASRHETPVPPMDPLLEKSFEVANEAASILASARKSARKKDRPLTTLPQQPVEALPPTVQPQQEAEERVPAPPQSSTVFPSQQLGQNQPAQRSVKKRDFRRPEKKQPAPSQTPPPAPSSPVLDEEPPTVEELEAVVSKLEIDAACLPWRSLVHIRAQVNSSYLQAAVEDEDSTLLQASGTGLDKDSEIFCLEPVQVLCYGNVIQLVSQAQQQLAVSVQPILHYDTVLTHQICLGPVNGQASQQWTVLRARPDGTVRVGPAAKAQDVSKQQHAPVRSGEPILLRHMETGGVLSIDARGRLALVTDSYRAASPPSSPKRRNAHSLLGRLQCHEVLTITAETTFCLLQASVPPLPQWMIQSSAYLDGSYLLDRKQLDMEPSKPTGSDVGLYLDHSGTRQADRLEQLQTPQGQERVLVEELLGAFVGLEGTGFVCITNNDETMQELEFGLKNQDDGVTLDPSLQRLVPDLLELATNYVRVNHFCARYYPGYEYGKVMQALVETLSGFLQDYATFCASLEAHYRRTTTTTTTNSELGWTLRGLAVQAQPCRHAMSVLRRVTEVVSDQKGGALLNALRELRTCVYHGDAAGEAILGQLLDKASVPYLQTLSKWLECGVLTDPYKEFMVALNEEQTWDEKYALQPEHVLQGFFATKVTVERVLATGRYWNAVQVCREADPVAVKEAQTLRYGTNVATVASYVQKMYHKASRSLVRLLLDDFNLLGSLRLMKRYFLLDHGDFFVNFLDAAEDELLKEVPNLSRGRIQHWLDVSIQLTEHQGEGGLVSSSPRKDISKGGRLTPTNLRCRFAPQSLTDHLDQLHAASGGIDTHEVKTPLRHAYGGMAHEGLTGLDAFVVDFSSIPFPISLVLSQRTRAMYQLLFRHLFFAKHVERRLVSIWQDHQAMKELQSLRGSLGSTFLLRQRMLHFLQNLIYYMMFEVIEPNWLEMEAAIGSPSARKEQTVDDILEVHNLFLRRSLEACLLTNRDLIRALTKLMTTCLLFSDQMKRFMKATKIHDDRHDVAAEKQKAVQRNLNDRGGSKAAVSHKRLQETMQNDRQERRNRVQRQTVRVEREVASDSYQKMIARFDEVFSDNLREFMLQLTGSDDLFHSHKVNLCIRLDYNGFVTAAMGLTSNDS